MLYAVVMTALILLALVVRDVTPEKTIQAFVDAFNAHDAAAMARRVVGGREAIFPISTDIPKLGLTLVEAKVAEDTATVSIELTATGATVQHSPSMHETVAFRKVGGDWQIVPVDPEFRGTGTASGPRPISSLAMLVTHPGVFSLAKKAAKRTVDLMKVKQVALATILYAADHKDRLPTAKGFKAAIYPYVRDADVFTAPDAPKGTVSYFLDPRLSGMRTTDIARPWETAMILEGTPAKTAFPWAGKTPVGYVDGHTKMLDGAMVFKARTIALK